MPISYPVMTKISMGTIHRLRRKTLTIMHILHSGYGLPVDGESLRRRLINWGLWKCQSARLNVYLRREAKKAFSCWRRCRPQAADVEGTPITSARVRKNEVPKGHIFGWKRLYNPIYSVRCPLHIPPLRRGPSPAGEGVLGSRPRLYVQPGAKLPLQQKISQHFCWLIFYAVFRTSPA